MGEKLMFLPKALLARARRRAAERGFSGVNDYIAELIRQDRAGEPGPAIAPSRANRVSRLRRRRESVTKIRKRLLDGMFSYMKTSEDPGFGYTCGYTLKHIDRCATITRDFLEKLSTLPKSDAAKIVAEVKRVVEKLNKLNASCGGALIETDQREDLCQFIETAANNAGLKSDQDVTWPWREW